MRFTEAEIRALRRMVRDWISEGFTTSPYPENYASVFDKLAIHPKALDASRSAFSKDNP